MVRLPYRCSPLLVGVHDLVAGPVLKDASRDPAPHGEVREFAESVNFVQLQQAGECAAVITRVAEPGRH
jgi:hypothetical protein